MKREVSLEEISDGKRYSLNDMVRADSGGCRGCSVCCRGMGRSIVLDPLDVHRMTEGIKTPFEQMLTDQAELNVVDGLVLPNLKMAGEAEACAFLDASGRCTIHPFRPGICRIFPLGRIYEDGGFRYFLQVHECRAENRVKVKVRRWIDTPDPGRYEKFVTDWHIFLVKLQERMSREPGEKLAGQISMDLLKNFYFTPFETDGESDFYAQFEQRLQAAAARLLIEERPDCAGRE